MQNLPPDNGSGLLKCLARYFVSGGVAALVDVGGFAVLMSLSIQAALAATASFGLAVLVNYGMSTAFVFRAKASWRGFFLFVAGALLGWVCNVGVTMLVLAHVAGEPVLAKVAGVGVAFGFNFFLNRQVVFAS